MFSYYAIIQSEKSLLTNSTNNTCNYNIEQGKRFSLENYE